MQPLIAILAGLLLGARAGALSVIVYIILGLIGLPVFATEPFGGPAYLLKPTFGFLLGQAAAAYVAGTIMEKCQEIKKHHYILASLVGVGVLYLVGLPYLFGILNFYLGSATTVGKVLQIGFLPFFLWDTVKAVVVALLAMAIHRRLPDYSPAGKGPSL
ncbi:hypothetical protein N752_22785 [Desulforamulus aquiferis]|nr:biotin transporter BioY [Desulforamulus aquiferis]RYD02843.1 hypothetical protein N752_22785 [Desulforamulus aquiferis]